MNYPPKDSISFTGTLDKTFLFLGRAELFTEHRKFFFKHNCYMLYSWSAEVSS